jgi:hypothetical protein
MRNAAELLCSACVARKVTGSQQQPGAAQEDERRGPLCLPLEESFTRAIPAHVLRAFHVALVE